MDLGNYEMKNRDFSYTAPDPQNSPMRGLMNTDYSQLKTDLQTPGDLKINNAYDKADYTIRDTMGGGGLYGSSIHSDAITNSARNRADSLASNSAQAGAAAAGLQAQENQWLGNTSLDEARLKNTWDMSQDQMDKSLIHDILMGTLGNDWNLGAIDKQGQWGMNMQDSANDANESASMWEGLGGLAGGLLGSFF